LDYEEFVEGLKPNCDDTETVTYKVEAGIFKKIAQKAFKDSHSGAVDNFEEVWDKLVEKLDSDNYITVKTISGNAEFRVELNEYGTGLANRTYQDDVYQKDNWISGKSKFFSKEQLYNIYKGLPGTPAKGHDNYRKAVIKRMKDADLRLKNFSLGSTSIGNDKKNYVLIIYEINRGNISKIFGELITLLEKDKRLGEENEITVTLPYSQETFGVSSNLYIIGTMNTADRSIGQIDYALRRRFAFETLNADRKVIEDYSYDNQTTKDKALDLFDAIKTFISENINEDLETDDLMIGHSYFLCKTEDELKRRLEYEIIPLIQEYAKDGIINCQKKDLKDNFEKLKQFQQ
jgi:5-methylcytosine-specific restriction protein B